MRSTKEAHDLRKCDKKSLNISDLIMEKLTAPPSIEVSVGISSNAAGSRFPGTSFPPHPVLKFPKWTE